MKKNNLHHLIIKALMKLLLKKRIPLKCTIVTAIEMLNPIILQEEKEMFCYLYFKDLKTISTMEVITSLQSAKDLNINLRTTKSKPIISEILLKI